MRKNTPAKKGFSPFKENKNSSSNKATQRPNASGRKRGDDDERKPFAKSDRPFSGARDKRGNDEGRPSSRGERSFPAGNRRGNEEGKPSPRGERSVSPGNKRNNDEGKPASRAARPFSPANKRGDDATKKPAERATPERDENGRRRRIEPVRKTANGRTPFKRSAQSDDSAFHGASDRKGKRGGNKDERSTPSGFNRKKFFDTTNERFADKQERKTTKKLRFEDTPITFGKKKPKQDDAPTPSKRLRFEDTPITFGKKKPKQEEVAGTPGEMPLNKYIAHSGLCSRRKAVDYVKEGKVTVNGKQITEPAFKVTAKDEVAINDRRITIQKNLVYILLNKPKGYITTTDDPEGRKTVMELIGDAVTEEQRVYPVGRLDRNTSGLLLLTNDGELAQKLAHPKHNIKKIYHVGLNKPLTKNDFERILQGVTLEDGVAHVDALGWVEPGDKAQVGIEIHSGKNRIVRRIFEHLEYEVEKLDRVTYAGLTKKNINRGKWRFLSEKEVILLKHFK